MNAGTGFLVVDIAGTRRRLDVSAVREVVRTPAVARVPASPPWVRGLAALRGRLIPVVELAARADRTDGYLVVIALGDRIIGIVVDRLAGVVDASHAPALPALDLGVLEEPA